MPSKPRLSTAILAAGLALLMWGGRALAQDTNGWVARYELIELTGADGKKDGQSRAYAINETAQVVGWVDSGGVRHSAHWQSDRTTDLHGTVHFALKHPYVLYNQDYSEAYGISNAGQVVGTARALIRCPDASFVIDNAFLLRPAVLSDLGTPIPGDALTNLMTFSNPCGFGYDSAATGISNTNYVVGWADTDGGVIRAFLVHPVNNAFVQVVNGGNTLLIDLGTIGGSDPVSSATAVNDKGQVTGYSYTITADGKSAYRAFLLTPQDTNADGLPDTWFVPGAAGQNMLMTSIGTLGGTNSWGRDINASGAIVGESDMIAPNGGYFTHAFLYANGTMTDLGTLRTDPTQGYSAASAINDAGVVVGWAENDKRERRAFLYKDGRMQDLNSLLYLKDADGNDVIPSITLTEARDINAAGVIVGWGEVRGSKGAGQTKGFMLNPILVNPDMLDGDSSGGSSGGTGGSSGGYTGTPIFGLPQHLQNPQPSTVNGSTAQPDVTTNPLLSLCGFGAIIGLALALAGLVGLKRRGWR